MPAQIVLDLDEENNIPLDQQESEDDVHPSSASVGEAVLFNTDWTVETLFRQIEKGNINLDPKFQRREAWDDERKSKFVESILSNFPIPNVVLAEDKGAKGRYIVIDGKQRLFTIFSFLKDRFRLKGLEMLGELNGSNFSDLLRDHSSQVSAIENYPIRTVIIRNWPDEDYLYTVFYRLNSGSLPLSPQELRRALHGGRLLDYLDEFIKESAAFKGIFGGKLDPRMRDVELILRYVAFEFFYPEYNGDLKKFLDRTVKYFDGAWDERVQDLDAALGRLNLALETSSSIFGQDAFKKWNGEAYERRINRAVFDVIIRFFSDESVAAGSVKASQEIQQAFQDLCGDQRFKNAIERTTKTPAATTLRLKLWGGEVARILDRQLDEASMRME